MLGEKRGALIRHKEDNTVEKLPRLLTIKEVAIYLSLSQRTVYRLIEEGTIPALKIGGQWRFDQRALDRWVAGEINHLKRNHRETPILLDGGEK